MKVLFVYTRTEDMLEVSGEAKKILMQIDALKNNGVDAKIIYHNRVSKVNKILVRIPFYSIYGKPFRKLIEREINAESYDAVYFRKYVIDSSFLHLIKFLRSRHPSIKILLEIPTFPYDLEWSSLIDQPLLIKEKIYRKRLNKYIDRIITFSDDVSIFGVKTIQTSNGIDLNKIKRRNLDYIENDNINLLGVACVEKWHGYDRLIQGIHNYYQDKRKDKRNIIFHIVGDGFEIPMLKRMVKSLSLDDHVVFYGSLYGQALDEKFNSCAIGVGSLGMRRIGLTKGYTLKLREYTARGIPFIYAYDDILIERSINDFYIKYPNNDSPIDMDKLISFYDHMQSIGFDEVATKMRTAASKYLTWETQMRSIADYINKIDKGEK